MGHQERELLIADYGKLQIWTSSYPKPPHQQNYLFISKEDVTAGELSNII